MALSSLSTHLHSHRRVAFRPLPHTRNARICCSVAPNNFLVPDVSQVQAPAAPAQTEDPKNKPECFGVFCLTYDLQAEEETKSWKKLINIAVSGAAGMISNHLLFKEFYSHWVLQPSGPSLHVILVLDYGLSDNLQQSKPYQLASGEVFGPDQPIALKLLGSERSFQALEVYDRGLGN
ncbi:hypothetical protein DVH24_013712 [Malus domestica]|uniref:Uncharacterized protein n=1 Tax=Malus domestica TaxID=3750 RepID=A0A498JD97_MALDO|nr:hypothetical protein DVH24_013712 [Malus domestica]